MPGVQMDTVLVTFNRVCQEPLLQERALKMSAEGFCAALLWGSFPQDWESVEPFCAATRILTFT